MPKIAFSDLPPEARLWIFPASRPLSREEEAELLSRVDDFLDQWAAHGSPLTSGREWREGRFLMIGVDESTAPPSGCSIDSLARLLKTLGAEWQMSFLDHSAVWFRKEGEAIRVSRSEFRALVEAGEADLATPVLDNAIVRVAELQSGGWDKPAGASWHQRAFFNPGPKES